MIWHGLGTYAYVCVLCKYVANKYKENACMNLQRKEISSKYKTNERNTINEKYT